MGKMQQHSDIKEYLLNVATQTGNAGMFILLLYDLGDSNTEVWMLPGTAKVMKWLPTHFVAEPLPQSVLSEILTKSLHAEAITGCITIFFWQKQDYNFLLE